jgi:hypothetical protein
VINLEIRIKNQLHGTIDFCIGMKEYTLEHEQDVIVPVSDGDYMYLDQLSFPKTKIKSRAVLALADIAQAMDDYKSGKIGWVAFEIALKTSVAGYIKATEEPIPNIPPGGIDND